MRNAKKVMGSVMLKVWNRDRLLGGSAETGGGSKWRQIN